MNLLSSYSAHERTSCLDLRSRTLNPSCTMGFCILQGMLVLLPFPVMDLHHTAAGNYGSNLSRASASHAGPSVSSGIPTASVMRMHSSQQIGYPVSVAVQPLEVRLVQEPNTCACRRCHSRSAICSRTLEHSIEFGNPFEH